MTRSQNRCHMLRESVCHMLKLPTLVFQWYVGVRIVHVTWSFGVWYGVLVIFNLLNRLIALGDFHCDPVGHRVVLRFRVPLGDVFRAIPVKRDNIYKDNPLHARLVARRINSRQCLCVH